MTLTIDDLAKYTGRRARKNNRLAQYREEISRLRQDGASYAQIASYLADSRALAVTKEAVYQYCKRYLDSEAAPRSPSVLPRAARADTNSSAPATVLPPAAHHPRAFVEPVRVARSSPEPVSGLEVSQPPTPARASIEPPVARGELPASNATQETAAFHTGQDHPAPKIERTQPGARVAKDLLAFMSTDRRTAAKRYDTNSPENQSDAKAIKDAFRAKRQ